MSEVPLCRLKNVIEGFRTYLHCMVQCGDTYANFKEVSEATSYQRVLHNENKVLMNKEFFINAFLKSNLRSFFFTANCICEVLIADQVCIGRIRRAVCLIHAPTSTFPDDFSN